MADALLEVENLVTAFRTETGEVRPVDGVSFEVRKGKTLALVGESGSGKSVTSLSVMGLVPRPNGFVKGGSIRLGGEELLSLSDRQMRRMRATAWP